MTPDEQARLEADAIFVAVRMFVQLHPDGDIDAVLDSAQTQVLDLLSRQSEENGRVFQAVIWAFEGNPVPDDLREFGVVKHAEAEHARQSEAQETLRQEIDRLNRGRETLIDEVDRLVVEAIDQHDAAVAAERENATLQAERDILRDVCNESNAVCVCGCLNGAHENYGEDGECCGVEGHECIRTCEAVAAKVATLQAQLVTAQEALKDAEVLRRQGCNCALCQAALRSESSAQE